MRPDIAQGLDSGFLHLIIHPTEQCNFRCTYCYERFDLGRMPPEIINGIRNLLARRHDLKTLHIGWFGGEPLVALDVIRQLSRTVQNHAALHGIDYSADMTTNGYRLTEAVARELVGLGISTYQVSMDGDADCHDRTRLRANGAGTFDTIWGNLTALLASDLDFEVMLRIHYHAENLRSIDALIDRLAAAFPGERRLELYFKNVGPLGGANDADFPFVERDRRQAVEARFADRVNGRLPVVGGIKGYVCYACKPNSLVIRADGSISKCTVALYDQRNIIGRLHPDGRLDIDAEKMNPWLDVFLTGSEQALACPVKVLPQRKAGAESGDGSGADLTEVGDEKRAPGAFP